MKILCELKSKEPKKVIILFKHETSFYDDDGERIQWKGKVLNLIKNFFLLFTKASCVGQFS